MKRFAICGVFLAVLSLPASAQNASAQKQWWMDEPVRLVLPLIGENLATLDADKLILQLVDMNANAILFPMGGIAAYYPTKIAFHYTSPFLPPGRDLFGEVLQKAHARGIHVMARFEWSMIAHKEAYDAHPDWFQRQANGKPNVWNGCYLTCVNGGYMQEQVFKILAEALEKYPIDGTFFNGGTQRMSDNNGNTYAPCTCDNCKRLFRAKYNRDIPAQPDAQYNEFIAEAGQSVLARISEFVHAKRPGLNFMLGRAQAQFADSFNSEIHSGSVIGDRPYWLYAASQTVNSERSTFPDKMAFDNDAAFLDGYWRFAHRSAPDGEIRAYQNMANGAGPYLFINGDMSQNDGNALKGARPAFQFHKDHEELYVRQETAARVLLLEVAGGGGGGGRGGGRGAGGSAGRGDGGGRDGDTSMRGFFRILSEQHIPFAMSNDLSWIDKEPNKYDLVISYRGAPAALDRYLRQGGRVLVAGATKPQLDVPPVVRLWKKEETQSAYWRVHDRALFPSLRDTDIVFFYSEYLELEPRGKPALTMIPTSMVGPMEKVHEDWKDTTKPGLYVADYGRGKLAYIPWDVGDLYYRYSPVYHSAIVGDLVDYLLPKGRQLKTNAHPMVEMTLQQQRQQGRTLVHFVNLSGSSQTAYHPAIPMSNIRVEVAGNFISARMVSLGRDLPVTKEGGYVTFTLPSLDTYDVVVLR
ncbi:MAG TPA: family 10 glycosylhydrolase [Candidatus Acidoferrales bacterium]|nr:family 10 glycosylhydrolase [Candidatus Acidoferrales bacterium]